ncbi:MAG: family 16 glycosylhydrolase [Pseudomonadota bacterium]
MAETTFEDDFDLFRGSDWQISTWAISGGWNNTAWSTDNFVMQNSQVTLELEEQADRGKDYTGAEFQSRDFYGYGIYEVTMKASGESGVNSSFFTYTGPVHGNQKNEIDFEFLGKDPTKVHLAYHSKDTDSVQGANSRYVDLGFDASAGFHTYRFEWKENSIKWFADDRLLWSVSGNDIGIPNTPGKMFMSIWSGVPAWLGDADFDTTKAVYRDVSYTSWSDYVADPDPDPIVEDEPDTAPIYELSEANFSGSPKSINKITLSGDFTIMGTIEFKEDRPVDNHDSLVGGGNYWNGNDLNFHNGKFRLYSADANPRDVVVAETKAIEGSEAHYAIVRKDGITKLFVNGQLEDKATNVWNANFEITDIGGGVQTGGLGGTIRDLKIFDEALTNADVATAATNGTSSNNQESDNPAPTTGLVDMSSAVFSMLGQTEISGNNSIVKVAPSGALTVDEATIAMFFEADSVSGIKSLFTRDATGYADGDHLRARIENGELVVRFQNEDGDVVKINAGQIAVNELYHLAITFGDWGARVFLDGERVGLNKEFDMDWLDNEQYLHIGGDGSAQASGSRKAINPFDGTISDFMIFDDQFGAAKIAEVIEAGLA